MFTFITFFVVLFAVYGAIHAWDRTRGTHISLIEVQAADGSWQTHELVRRGDHYRLLALVWTSNWSKVKRSKIVASCPGSLDKREARQHLSESMGAVLRHSHETYQEYVTYTQSHFRTAA